MNNFKSSVVIIDHDDPILLSQTLTAVIHDTDELSAEVIVVVEKGKRKSEDVLERLRPQYPQLRVTFVPDSARRMDNRRIALTLGIKAAANDTVTIYDTFCNEFSPFRVFSNKVRHRRLTKHNGTGIDFGNDSESISLNKQLFLERDHFDNNLTFLCLCYDRPAIVRNGAWLTRLKYLLSKCHLYSV